MDENLKLFLERLSYFLNDNPKGITINQVNKVTKAGVSKEHAVRALVNEYIGLDDFANDHYDDIFKLLNPKDYECDEYYSNIKLDKKNYCGWEIKYEKYDAYEMFVYDDFKEINGVVVPQIGYFEKPFSYPAVLENKRLWMSVTPNEINTMRMPIDLATGNVVTFGMGLGYFAYMASNKDDVTNVTIVERDSKIINLFKTFILPKFKNVNKITIIESDAYAYLKKLRDGEYDFMFIDIYHDASDGINVYNKMRKYTDKFTKTMAEYWIIETIKQYL